MQFINLIKKIKNKVLKSIRLYREYLYLKNNPLFSKEYYLKSNIDVAKSKINPLMHYIVYGYKEERNPHPLFDIHYYMMENQHVLGYNMNPVIHYLKYGYKECARPHPLFDTDFYLMQNPDVVKSGENPLLHYLSHWDNLKLRPHPLFDSEYYVLRNPEVKNQRMMPIYHYLMNWGATGVTINVVFANMALNDSEVESEKVEYQDPIGIEYLKNLIKNERILRAIYEHLKNGNFQMADSLYPRKQVIRKTNVLHTKIFSMREKLEGMGQLVHLEKQPEREVFFSSSNKYYKLTPPNEYIGILNDVTIVGGTRLVLDSRMNLLHDEMAELDHSENGEYDVKIAQYVKVLDHKEIEIYNTRMSNRSVIKEGILISCDHDNNYFHFLVECLPKVQMIKECAKYEGIPLLIGKNLHPNFVKAIEIIADGKYPILQLLDGVRYNVNKMIYPSDLSHIMDKYDVDYKLGEDVVLSNKWIKKIRNQLICIDESKSERVNRKLYLTRRTGTYRKLLNEEELEIELMKRGFEIVDLSGCSFAYQQQLFRQANIVIGPTGATITNMMLSPEHARFIVITSDHEGIMFELWEQLADACEVEVKFCVGKRAFNRDDFHDDYNVPIQELLKLVEDNNMK